MTRQIRVLALLGILLTVPFSPRAGDLELREQDLPRVSPTDPGDALRTFRIKKGFQVELAAAEPLVVSPVALAFDENGRLFVVEMRDYSERRSETPHLGRIRMLEDVNGDGRFDRSTVYADNLPWPTAVTCYAGGVFVGATPDIIFCKDTNGDGVAEVREVVFTGFASDYAPYQTNRLNVQAMLNSFNWGLDNRIHGATSLSGGKVGRVDSPFTREWIRRTTGDRAPAGPGMQIDLRGRDFSFDPRTLELRTESGGGQHGLTFDSRGRKFVCSNSDHIQLLMYEDRYATGEVDLPSARVSIAADGPAAEVFRISPDEPWRVIRTKWRVAGMVPGPVEGGGRASGYFTGATGTTIYRGDAFPEEYRENAFVADCGSNLVHRKRLEPDADGVGLIARRAEDERNVEFLASTDNWFRPVQFANGPDGCLYLADMYREVIEHPWSLPDSIKQHLDLNSGNDRGRIYRMAPVGFQHPKPQRLGEATTTELVSLLASANGWKADTAARLLYERQDRAAAAVLEQLLQESTSPSGKVRALHALNGLNALANAHLLTALADSSDSVRQHAVRLTEALSLSARSQMERELGRLAGDSSALVRYQLCWTLGSGFQGREKAGALAAVARRDSQSAWVRGAILSSLNREASTVFEQLFADAAFRDSVNGRMLLVEIARVMGRQRDTNGTLMVLDRAVTCRQPELGFGLAAAARDGWLRNGGSFTTSDLQQPVDALAQKASAIASNRTAPEADRVAAVRFVAAMARPDSRATLSSLLAVDQSDAVRLEALVGLGRIGDAGVADELLNRWEGISPAMRNKAVSMMLTRSAGTRALLEAVGRGVVSRTEFSTPQLQGLRTHSDPEIRRRSLETFGGAPTAERQEVVSSFVPSLALSGDAGHGRTIYRERCASCHRLGGEGSALGPDLATVKASGKETLLVNILDPNRQVAPSYLNYTIETKDGQTLSGVIATESTATVSLRGPNGAESVVARPDIEQMRTDGKSFMPEGLEVGLKTQDLADLLAWITSVE